MQYFLLKERNHLGPPAGANFRVIGVLNTSSKHMASIPAAICMLPSQPICVNADIEVKQCFKHIYSRTCDTAEVIARCNLTGLLLCDSLATSCVELRSPAREAGERVSCPNMLPRTCQEPPRPGSFNTHPTSDPASATAVRSRPT